MADERDVEAVLADRPGLESALESIRAVDDAHDTWTFDDLSLDSGTFGQLVSEGLVEKTDSGEYRLPEATRQALDGGETAPESTRELSVPRVDIDQRAAGALAGALGVVVVFRVVFAYGAVFRGDHVVLSANDAYFYRYLVELLLAEANGVDLTLLAALPKKAVAGEPLMVSTMYLLAALLGGTATAAGTVLAWYPVVSALLTGLVVYLLAVRLTKDRRIGLASVLVLATMPAHAFRTSLGYADHHVFSYSWLAVTALALVVLAQRDDTGSRDPVSWALGGGVGLGIAGQILSWENGMVLLVPVVLYVMLVPVLDLRAGRSPLRSSAPLVGGLAVGAVVVQAVHTVLGWHTGFVAATPVLVFGGAIGVLLCAEGIRRAALTPRILLGIELVGGVSGLFLLQSVAPTIWSEIQFKLDRFVSSRNIVETNALITGDLTWLYYLGLAIFLAAPVVLWASRQARAGSRAWLAATLYTVWTTVLALFQIRFTGHLSIFLSVFAGFGFVWLAHWVGLLSPPAPFDSETATDGSELELPAPRQLATILALFLALTSVSIVQVPILTEKATIDEGAYETAVSISEYAAAQNIPTSDRFAVSRWGKNRMFNYFISGEAAGFGIAKYQFRRLATWSDGDRWYRKTKSLSKYRVASQDGAVFLVTEPARSKPGSLLRRLHMDFGSETDEHDALSNYQAISASSQAYRVFRLVPGATVRGTAPANTTTTLSKQVEIPGATFTYTQTVQPNATGMYTATVPYPGTYTLWNQTVSVSQRNVTAGDDIHLNGRR